MVKHVEDVFFRSAIEQMKVVGLAKDGNVRELEEVDGVHI